MLHTTPLLLSPPRLTCPHNLLKKNRRSPSVCARSQTQKLYATIPSLVHSWSMYCLQMAPTSIRPLPGVGISQCRCSTPPHGIFPTLGVDASGSGWIFQYSLQSDRQNLQKFRSHQDWYLSYTTYRGRRRGRSHKSREDLLNHSKQQSTLTR